MMFDEKTITDEVIYRGTTIELHKLAVELPNNQTAVREIIHTRDSVAVIALTVDNEILLVKQFRKACERVLTEVPAGRIDEGELPIDAAKRELLEETGYGNGTISLVSKVFPSVGTNKTTQYIYLCENVEQISDKLSLDADEFLEVIKIPLKKFETLFLNGEIVDMKTVLAYMYLRDRI